MTSFHKTKYVNMLFLHINNKNAFFRKIVYAVPHASTRYSESDYPPAFFCIASFIYIYEFPDRIE